MKKGDAASSGPPDVPTFRAAKKAFLYLLLAAGAALCLVPFLWMVSSSLKTAVDVQKIPPDILPRELRLSNYLEAWRALPFTRFLFNTLFITLLSIAGELVSCSLVAYGFARFRFPGRRALFVILLSTMMIPAIVTLVPVFLFWRALGLVNTFDPLVLGSLFGVRAFYVFLLRQFFASVPRDLEEAAVLDGASPLQVFWHVFLPLVKPSLLAVALISFAAHWNDFLGPLVFLNDFDKYTMTLGLHFFQGSQTGERPAWNLMMAMTTLMAVPVLTIFFLAQKRFVEGASFTGMKD